MIHVKFIDGPLAGSEHFLTCRDTEKVVTIANAIAERVVQVSEYELTDAVEGRTRLCKFIRAQTCVAPPPNTAQELPPDQQKDGEQVDLPSNLSQNFAAWTFRSSSGGSKGVTALLC